MPFVKDVALVEPSDLWTSECKQHINSFKERGLYVTTPDLIPRELSLSILWDYAKTHSASQLIEREKGLKLLEEMISDEMARINPSFANFDTSGDTMRFMGEPDKYCQTKDLARYIYRELGEAAPDYVGWRLAQGLVTSLGQGEASFPFQFDKVDFNLRVTQRGAPKNDYALVGDYRIKNYDYAVSHDKNELEALLQFINNLPNAAGVQKALDDIQVETAWTKWALQTFQKGLIELTKDLESFGTFPGTCERCP